MEKPIITYKRKRDRLNDSKSSIFSNVRSNGLDSPTSSPSSSQTSESSSQLSSQITSPPTQISPPSSQESTTSDAQPTSSSSISSPSSSSPPSTPTKKLKQWEWWKSKSSDGSPTQTNSLKKGKNNTPKKKDTPKKDTPTKKKMEQTFLDLGQKHFDAKLCAECGMMFAPGVQEDVLMHAKFHKKHESIVNFPQWKTCKIVKEYAAVGSVICVTKDDTAANQKKVSKVRKMMDKELGYVDAANPNIETDHKIFLFISTKSKVVGCIVAERIEHAYPVIIIDHSAKKEKKEESDKEDTPSTPTKSPINSSASTPSKKQQNQQIQNNNEQDDLDLDKICEIDNSVPQDKNKGKSDTFKKKDNNDDDDLDLDKICELDNTVPTDKTDKVGKTDKKTNGKKIGTPKSKKDKDDAGIKNFSVSCSKEAKEAVCGISRIWTARTHRRQGVASKMLDCVRANLIYGYTVPKEMCAFSQPTADGKLFFENYRGTKEFLVYL